MENCNVNQDGLSLYEAENQAVAEQIMEEYFLKHFKPGAENIYGKNVELIVSPRCNLGCKYCYLHRYRKDIFGEECFNEELTLKNLKLFLKWLEKNEYAPNIEIFSGELFGQEIGYKVFDVIIEHEKQIDPILRPKLITIPTNFTFMCSPEAEARVENIRARLRELNIELGLSASFDGKYMEQNRPYLHDMDVPLGGKNARDDNYYNKTFDYIKASGSGIHPMVYSQGIEKWKQNFLWFQEEMAKRNIPWESIYLLQVRNEEWTAEQIHELQDFIRFLYEFVWEKVDHSPEFLCNFILKANGFNMLAEPFTSTGRGLTCGIQGQFTIRLSDLMMYPCHRLGYKDFWFGQFVEDEEKNLTYKNLNVELMNATYYCHHEVLPYCANCAIRHCCVGPCLGAQYESNRNLFAPIPTVCNVMFAIVATSIECLLKYGAYNTMMSQLDAEKQTELAYVKKEIEKRL